jgi:murein DD-endopeptidase MepM/ murein hydrolase activator NlpD
MRSHRFTSFAIATVATLTLIVGLTGPTSPAVGLASDEYPTWSDVLAARSSENAAKAKISQLRALIEQLKSKLAAAQALAIEKGAEYETAQDAFDAQALVTDELTSQADGAKGAAEKAKRDGAQVIAALARTGDGDLTAVLLTQSSDADGLLYRLGALNQISERSENMYTVAVQLQNTARSLADQAEVAKVKLDELRAVAEAAFQEAQKAAQDAADALEAQSAHQAQLEAQLAVLVDKRQATEADYQAGVKARWGANAGIVSESGWAKPTAGYISSPFGMRYHPIYHTWRLHNGTDIAGGGCGAPIYATHAGTVTYAGPNGTLGNYIQIEHGDGTSSGYGHILPGGIHVRYGQHVDPGQPIAQVGSTGASTGCHLHFIIRVNGQVTDPVPFLRQRGITLG